MKTLLVRSAFLMPLCIVIFALSVNAQAVSLSSVRARAGTSPADALAVTCNWESLPPASHIWYQWPRSDDELLYVQLVSYPETLKGMEFQVYAAQPGDVTENSDLAGPVGYDQASDTRIVREWKGTPITGATYYVDVVNHSIRYADYGLCAR